MNSGCRVQKLGFRIWGLGLNRFQSIMQPSYSTPFRFKVEICNGPGFRVQYLGFRVKGLRFQDQGLGFRVWALGFRIQPC